MTITTDVCIVGAGPAGGLLAASLARLGHDVVVLDAGPRFDPSDRLERMERSLRPAFDRTDVWDMGGDRDAYSLSGAVEYALNRYRVKGIGGSSLHWRATAPRLHPADFEMRTRYGVGADWPIAYDDLAPYYLAAERELGVAGEASPHAAPRTAEYPMTAHPPSRMDDVLADGFASVGADLHPAPRAVNSEPYDGRSACVGYGTCSPVCPSGAKYTADTHVDRAEEAGATVLDRAPVQRLRHDATGERIVEAIFVRDGEDRRVEADQFVVAAGGVESARLLLLSGSDRHPDGLANGSGLVGRHFADHPLIGLIGRVDEPTASDQIGFETSLSEAYYPHDHGPVGSTILKVENLTGQSPPEIALDRRTNAGHLIDGDPVTPLEGERFGDAILDRVADAYEGRVRIEAMVEQLPDPENRVTLDDGTRDDHGNPVPDIDYTIDEATRRTLAESREVLYEIFDAVGVYDVEPIASPSDPYFVSHHLGTTRMGSDPATSVVNENLRAHGLENLYVSSSATFTTFGASPPTLTIAALTLRLANHIHRTRRTA